MPNRLSPKERLFQRLLRGLAEGQWPAGTRLPSMRRLSVRYRTSPTTLVAVIRRFVALGLVQARQRREVVVCCEAQDRARDLLRSRCRPADRRLVILFPDRFAPLAGAPFFHTMAMALAREAARNGLIAEPVPISAEGGLEQVQRITRRFDIAFGLGLRPENLAVIYMLVQHGLPLVVFNRDIPGVRLPCLRQDDYSAARRLVGEFASRGHRNLCLMALQHYEILHGRRSHVVGWIDALRDADLLDGCSMPVVEVTGVTMAMAINHLLRNLPGITGLVIPSNTALYLSRAVADLGLAIPGDLSVVATGWVDPAEWRVGRNPPLTTIDFDSAQFARLAIEMIGRLLAGETHVTDMRLAMNIHLTESLGPVPPR